MLIILKTSEKTIVLETFEKKYRCCFFFDFSKPTSYRSIYRNFFLFLFNYVVLLLSFNYVVLLVSFNFYDQAIF